jgi:hypothetical protein
MNNAAGISWGPYYLALGVLALGSSLFFLHQDLSPGAA